MIYTTPCLKRTPVIYTTTRNMCRKLPLAEDNFLPARPSKRGNSYGNVSGWVAGWLAVTLRYCIKTAKPIWKRFRLSESAIILVSTDPCAYTQFQGGPLQRGR